VVRHPVTRRDIISYRFWCKKRLSSGRGCGSRSSGVDIRAEQSLAEDGQDAALGLLALDGADVDEAVDVERGCGSWRYVSMSVLGGAFC